MEKSIWDYFVSGLENEPKATLISLADDGLMPTFADGREHSRYHQNNLYSPTQKIFNYGIRC